MRFPIVIHKDPDSDHGVTVPDLPGCFSAGSTMDEALTNVVEAIELHLEGMLEDGESIPMPRTVEAHIGNPDFTGGTWALVSIDLSKLSGKVRRVNITLPERLLNVLDRYATEHGETRSGLIARATMRYIAQQDD
ncbi:MAG: type II toxin-antitoxin system HicB family antitoxin [Caldilineae bacterium]|nr:type II toxin-antitoxin system HicB family antitoxin [Chloroflexota bacterium]MCB9176836.1 type II toxin-antitoxin system HicB family antitoxin [Caldilineae bacterium]